MTANVILLETQVVDLEFSNYVRIIPSTYKTTPLGCSTGVSRFGGTAKSFAILYAAYDLATAVAETVVRDRFENVSDRRLFLSEIVDLTAVQIETISPLRVVDLRAGGCLKLGISTDIAGAKCFGEAQQFSDFVYGQEAIDGILYASRLTARDCVAIFDRAITQHLKDTAASPLVQVERITSALSELNVRLIA